jgi:hypothetical protein
VIPVTTEPGSEDYNKQVTLKLLTGNYNTAKVMALQDYLRETPTKDLQILYKEMTPWYKGLEAGYNGAARNTLANCKIEDTTSNLVMLYHNLAVELLNRA